MSHIRLTRHFILSALALGGAGSALADWDPICPPPPMTNRFSDDFGATGVLNPLMHVTMGTSGTTNWGGGTDPGCFAAGVSGEVVGRFGFGLGQVGTMHTDLDNFMPVTWGFIYPGGTVWGRYGYATVQEDATSTMFGANGFQTVFSGESDNYFFARTTNGNVQIDLRVDLVADAGRFDWTMRNIDPAAPHAIGLRFGQAVSLLNPSNQMPAETFVTVPGRKPLRVEERFTRATDPSGFPSTVDFAFSQADGVGFRVQNTADEATTDTTDATGSQTSVDGFVFGSPSLLLGTAPGRNQGWGGGATGVSNTFPDVIFNEPQSDILAADNPAFIQTWAPQSVGIGSSRRIVAFYRTTWSDALYARPYSAAVDTPKVINLNPANASAFAANPFPIRVYIDNNRGFATVDQELPLQDVRVELLLPTGLTAVGGNVRTISRIDAKNMASVDFNVAVDDFLAGDQTYQVRISPTPGPVRTITGSIKVLSQPKLKIKQNANLVTSPWTFTTPTWETILNLRPDADYQSFTYDPVQKAYIVSTGPTRGKADWIIAKNEQDISLGGSPQAPTDGTPTPGGVGGAPLITLKPGWNLIGNPYQTSIQIGQITGSAASNSSSAFTFSQLVQQGVLSGSLAFWDAETATYRFIQRLSDSLEPQKGYWIYVFSAQDVVLRYPGVFTPFARSYAGDQPTWQQSDKQWRLQLAARNNNSADDMNYVGIASTATIAKATTIQEPPMAPLNGALSLAVVKDINGTPSRLAQSLSEKPGRQEFKLQVDAANDGPVTLTWPNLSTIPKNVRVRLIDSETGETRDLRKVSGYRFEATAKLTREFKIQVETGVTNRAAIGNVVVSRNGRGSDASVRLTYTLTGDATTTVRILGVGGKEVMTISRGRADKAGQNEAVWNLKDQANRSMPPGTYRAEIIAEGNDGERSRKIVPILVTR